MSTCIKFLPNTTISMIGYITNEDNDKENDNKENDNKENDDKENDDKDD